MAVTHHATVRNTLANAILTAIDQDVGAGDLVFWTSGSAEVATCQLSDPAGTVTGAVLTFSAISDDTTPVGGTVAKFVVEDNSGDDIFYGAVATTGSDINLSSLVIATGDTVSVSSLTYTAPV